MTCFVHTEGPGSQSLKAAKPGDRCAQYFLADTWFNSGDLSKVEYWAQKAANNGDANAYALPAQIKVINPVSLDYLQVKTLAEKATQAGNKAEEITLACILVNTQVGHIDHPRATTLPQNAFEDLENDSVANAQMLLELTYASGTGIPADDEKATRHLKRSPTTSRVDYSEYWAGMIFLNDEQGFIVKDKQKALHWLSLSCMKGSDTGREKLDRLTNGQPLQA